jgi:hypothetical protein
MKNIHIIKTDKPSRLRQNKITKKYSLVTKGIDLTSYTPVNIYITSDEEIKDVRPHKGKWQLEKEQILNKFPNYLTDLSECKLVILTTDQDLIKDGVQAIDDEFLQWFVKNPSCEFVEVKKGKMKVNDDGCRYGFPDMSLYEIIIPKEEPKMIECYFVPSNNTSSATICGNCGKEKFLHTIGSGIKTSKQQTLEEAVEKYAEPYKCPATNDNEYCKHDIISAFIEGAEWQQEKMYSEEEVLQLLLRLKLTESYDNLYDWFQIFKKK